MAVDDSYTKVLLHLDGPNNSYTIVDESGKEWFPSGAYINTDFYKFEPASLCCGGADFVYTFAHNDLAFGSDDFTIDFWIHFAWSVPTSAYFCGHSTDVNNFFYFRVDGSKLNFRAKCLGATVIDISRTHTFTGSEWHHVAIVRNGNECKLFIDGQQLGNTGSATGAMPACSAIFTLGAAEYCGSYLTGLSGWIDEFRISKGIARWTSNFTPPTSPYIPILTYHGDFADHPLTVNCAITDFALQLLDFYQFLFNVSLKLSYNDGVLDFDSTPLEVSTSSDFSFLLLDSGLSPFIVTVVPGVVSGRGWNLIAGELPTLLGSSGIEVRSAKISGELPEMVMGCGGLVGEIAQVNGAIPAIGSDLSGLLHLYGSITGLIPGLIGATSSLPGKLAHIDGSLPAIRNKSSGYQGILAAIEGVLPVQRGRFIAWVDQTSENLDEYTTHVLNLKNMSIVRYSNYNFNSFCNFRGVLLGANENGIYVLDGKDDDGKEISASFKLPVLDLLNHLPVDLWFSLRNSAPLSIKIWQNEGQEEPYVYTLNECTDTHIHQERVKLGRGLNARFVQLEISNTSGGSMDINGLMVVANPLRPSKR